MAAAGGGSGGSRGQGLPFITVDDDGKFTVHDTAIEYLSALKGKVAVVSIAGLYRTGKSFLLNLLAGGSSAFQVGPTVRACTKGVWIYGKALPLEDGSDSDTHLVFLDTEGLSSTDRSETYDSRVFALALLLSSYFIYNSVGTIDGAAVARLSLVVNLTKHIHVRTRSPGEEDTGTEYAQFFPHFLWVVRDFTVKLEREGRRITARDYLEDALKPEDGISEAVDQKNAIRMLLRSFFPERDCITMVRPMSDEAMLSDLSKVPFETLRPEFQSQVQALRKRVTSTVRPKTMYGRPINGTMLSGLAVAYCQALNDNQAPTISTAWERVVAKQCEAAVESALRVFMTSLRDKLRQARVSPPTLPPSSHAGAGADAAPASAPSSAICVEEEELDGAYWEALIAALSTFRAEAVRDDDRLPAFEAKLLDSIRQAYSQEQATNLENSQTWCRRVAENAVSNARTSMEKLCSRSGEKLTAESVSRFYRRVSLEVAEEYRAGARGPAKYAVLCAALAGSMQEILESHCDALSKVQKAALLELENTVAKREHELAQAVSAQEAAKEQREQDKRAFDKVLAEQAKTSATESEHLRTLVASKDDELLRLSAKQDALIAAFEKEVTRGDKRNDELTRQLSDTRSRLEESMRSKVTELVSVATLSAKLAESQSALAASERRTAEAQSALAEVQKDLAVLRERSSGGESELKSLRDQTALLYESVTVQKELLAAKIDEKEECEYQWGATKAELAKSEGDKLALEAELRILENLAQRMKRVIVSAKKQSMLNDMDRLESRKYDEL